jgi:hypothetical protein
VPFDKVHEKALDPSSHNTVIVPNG